MKFFITDYKGATKIPAMVEAKINAQLERGALKSINIFESHGGRMFIALGIDDAGQAKTKCRVLRNAYPEKLQAEMNAVVETGVKIKHTHVGVTAQSNNLIAIMFYDA